MKPMRSGYEYKGWTYAPWEEHEPGLSYIFHQVEHEELGHVFMPVTGYDVPTEESFKAWIELGMPERTVLNIMLGRADTVPPKNADIIELYIERTLLNE